MTLRNPPRLWTSVVICVLLALTFSIGELLLDCRAPTSEGCVWGKALWPVTIAITLVVGVLAGLLLHLIHRALTR